MTEQEKRDLEKKERLAKYSTRLTFWTNQSLVQFGYSINLFTTISIGVVGFLVSKRAEYPHLQLNCDGNIEYGLLGYCVSLILAFVAAVFGGISVLSRLYDFRLTRHKLFVRKQTLENLNKMLPDGFIDMATTNVWRNFRRVLYKKISFVIETDYKDYDSVKNKFEEIRKQCKLLGDLSYLTHKIQIVLLFISILTYSFLILK